MAQKEDGSHHASYDDLHMIHDLPPHERSPTRRETKSLHDLHLAVQNSEDKRVTEFLTSDESQIRPPSKGKTTKTDNVADSEFESTGVPLQIQDEAAVLGDVGGGHSNDSSQTEVGESPRLLLVSTKIRNSIYFRHSIKPSVIFVQYKYDSMTTDGILALVNQTLNERKVDSIALMMSCCGPNIQISGKDDKVKVTMSRDIAGNDSKQSSSENKINVGKLYFRMEKLRGLSGNNQQSLAGFEKIQTVGKGAYGAAVLYRKKDDDSLVILKEINMHDLNAAERQLALNEVSILAMLDHPNIISYYDSFEEDGVLMIEIEYADGGTLAQKLAAMATKDKNIEEKEVLQIFQQIVAAIRHIHELNILHRDLKTANIFLTKEGVVKVGDFGISKMLSSANKGANTVLGTPYYISPEMCEGKPYNDKSDIWALGCILYEMACLQKTFEGSNLPALVNKIMKGQFAPVKGNYSEEFKSLIMDMLKQDPDERPSANEIMYTRLPELLNRFEDPDTDEELSLSQGNVNDPKSKKKLRSVFFYFESCTASMTPIELPPKIKIRHAAVGEDHVIVVTTEKQVYSWGSGDKGQLGHGNMESKMKPELVQSLNGKSISRACCGEGFSIFASDNGIVLTCGDGTSGCLGHGDTLSCYRPRLIETLLSLDVIAISCGSKHVVVVGSEGEVLTWGCGADGRLGLGTEDNHCQPQELRIEEPVVIRDVFCGVDGTMFLTDVGSVYACGSNSDNKLGLNNRQGFIMAMKNIFTKTEVEGSNVPTPVRALARHRVLGISMGACHTAVIVEPGHIYTFGKNSEGQLGIGDTKPSRAPVEVKAMLESVRVQCGNHYTVCSTTSNELYYWGLRNKTPVQTYLQDNDSKSSTTDSFVNNNDLRLESVTPRSGTTKASHSRQPSLTSVTSATSNRDSMHGSQSSVQGEIEREAVTLMKSPAHRRQTSIDSVASIASLTDSGLPSSTANTPQETTPQGPMGFRPLSSVRKRTPSEGSLKPESEHGPPDNSEIIFPPMHLMKILKSGDEMLTISGFFCHGENLFIQMETTAPPPRRKKRKKIGIRKRFSGNTLNVPAETQALYTASSREGGDEYSSEASEIDTQGTVPAWIKNELRFSGQESKDDGNEADDTSDQSDDTLHRRVVDSSMSNIQINKNLAPNPGIIEISPRDKKKEQTNEPSATNTSKLVKVQDFSRRSISTNSTESEIDCSTDNGSKKVPAWIKNELRFSGQESKDDGNEADDTSDQSDDTLHRRVVDSSMSNIQINKNLAPNPGIIEISPRDKKKEQTNEPSSTNTSKLVKVQDFSRRSISTNSTESEIDCSTDNGSKKVGDSVGLRKSSQPTAKKPPQNRLPPGPQRPVIRGKGQTRTRGNDLSWKEKLAARGFVSDVTVKRKQEALQNELEITREEKKKAEEKLREMEEEHKYQREMEKRELERRAQEREKNLEAQIQMLKQQLESHCSQLQDNQKLLTSLQSELTKVKGRNHSNPDKDSRVCAVM
uniref:non-specific serine/threonine protein kinase n=1 Tax=Magallana gigas TaxID=29159 RepID=K1QS00_MAGGI